MTEKEKIELLREAVRDLMESLRTASPLADQTYSYNRAIDALHQTRPE